MVRHGPRHRRRDLPRPAAAADHRRRDLRGAPRWRSPAARPCPPDRARLAADARPADRFRLPRLGLLLRRDHHRRPVRGAAGSRHQPVQSPDGLCLLAWPGSQGADARRRHSTPRRPQPADQRGRQRHRRGGERHRDDRHRHFPDLRARDLRPRHRLDAPAARIAAASTASPSMSGSRFAGCCSGG